MRIRAREVRGGTASRGAVTTELVIATPVLLLLIMAVVQFALWQHGVHIAEAAAQEGCSAARVQDGTNAAGESQAQHILTVIGGPLIVGPAVNVSRTAVAVTVQVSGSAEQVVPLLPLPISATCSAPIEPVLAAR